VAVAACRASALPTLWVAGRGQVSSAIGSLGGAPLPRLRTFWQRRVIRAASFLDFCSLPFPKTSSAPSASALFQASICPGWTRAWRATGPPSLALQRLQGQGGLKAGLSFLRTCDISCSFPTAINAPSLGAGHSLRYLYEIPGPSHLSGEVTHEPFLE
jgi:hypothetical protein